jgi:hypothetical protein
MEHSKPIPGLDGKKIFELLGDTTDIKSELLIDNMNDDSDIKVKEGDFIEKYFNEKLKFLLKSKEAFPITIDISQILDEMILSINYSLIENDDLKPDIAKEIIKKMIISLKNETKIQIDSLIPMIEGKQIFDFYERIKEFSFPSINNINKHKKYTVIVESTFCLESQIVKKVNQLRKSFLLFSLLHRIYLSYPKYVGNYYKYFIRRYILKQKAEIKKINTEDDKLDLSPYGNYLFLIMTDKSLETFNETKFLVKQLSFGNKFPDESLKKCFEKGDNSTQVEYKKEEHELNEKEKFLLEKISKDPILIKAYKELNYMLINSNDEQNCFAQIIYFDSYLNLTIPKCLITQVMQQFYLDAEKQKKMNENLKNIVLNAFPGFDFSKIET